MQLLVFFLFQLRCNFGITNFLPKKTFKNSVLNLKKVKNGRNSIFIKILLIPFFLGTTDMKFLFMMLCLWKLSRLSYWKLYHIIPLNFL